MPNVRPIGKIYNISKHRFYELYHGCLQYNEWKSTLKQITAIKSVQISDMPKGSNRKQDLTADIAIKYAELEHKCNMIEEAVKAADAELYDYLLYAVTNEGITYNYLSNVKNMPCGKNKYYIARRRFYWHLDKLMK